MWSSKREPFPSPCMVLSMRLLTLGAGTVTGSRATATAGIQAACTEDGYSSDFLKEQTVLQPKVNANTFFFPWVSIFQKCLDRHWQGLIWRREYHHHGWNLSERWCCSHSIPKLKHGGDHKEGSCSWFQSSTCILKQSQLQAGWAAAHTSTSTPSFALGVGQKETRMLRLHATLHLHMLPNRQRGWPGVEMGAHCLVFQ